MALLNGCAMVYWHKDSASGDSREALCAKFGAARRLTRG